MGGHANNPVEPLVEPLTRREREILALLAEGQSGPGIAEKLTLAVSSVKWYIHQIYGKLGVNSKQQALLRAAELGLLASGSEQQPTLTARHNLPLQVTRFFGRESEIAQLKARLAEHRLVTLAGSGGVGKTRLSQRAAEEMLDDFADGVWFAELAPLTDPAVVTQTVARAVGVRDEPGQPVLDTLIHTLRSKQVLLLLDNCEHLLEACATLADSLLRACPRLKILASSREPLGVAGEAVLAVPSLPFPTAGQALTAERLGEYPAARLFVDRARLVLPDYEPAPNAAAITRICRRLDGIPLAIEMAAARMNLLSSEQLAERLDDVFRVLTGGSRTALPRQQTLRATLDWSYRLLSEEQRRLLARLSVFAGGCTLEAAEAVCAGEGLEEDNVLDLLGALVAKSMVIAGHPPRQEPRYNLLETVRQYAREKLNEARETPRLHTRHRDYFLSFAETNFPKLETKEQPVWSPKLLAELDNLRQAIEWSFSGDPSNVEAGLRLLITAGFNASPSHQERLDWFDRGLALCQSQAGISARLHVKLLEQAATVALFDDLPTGLAWSKQAVKISRGLVPEDKETLMWSLMLLSWAFILAFQKYDPGEAAATFAEAESILQELGPGYYGHEEGLRVNATFAARRADVAIQQGRFQDAKDHAAECLRLFEQSGSPWVTALGHFPMAVACEGLGAHQEAQEHFQAALDVTPDFGFAHPAFALLGLGRTYFRLGNPERALDYCRESIRQADRTSDRSVTAGTLWVMAEISAQQGQPARAARLAGASAAMWARQKGKPYEEISLDTLLPGWREGPEQAAISEAYEAGQGMLSDEAVAYALGD